MRVRVRACVFVIACISFLVVIAHNSYACEEWVVTDDSFEDLAHLREQLSTIQNQMAPPSVTRSGRVIRSPHAADEDTLKVPASTRSEG